MIDRVAIIWANGTASVDWPLTDELYKLEHVAALTAVFGPSHDKLATVHINRFGPPFKGTGYVSTTFEPDGTTHHGSYMTFEKCVDHLLQDVADLVGAPDRSGFHKEDQ